ncbi:nucleotidyltransferase domain-containing protein [Nocardioides sp. NPDC051685]|uniref:nucleotidyltransferase domain-containing protein n=1 Tax=Nocardioides sp. NPDC051685 TaxID=3364334 RepID=UPI00378F7DCF
MTNRSDPVAAAKDLVRERFPGAQQAWLGGSVVLGGATPMSDLDITVLDATATVNRESLRHLGWPVELFVHTEASIRHFVTQNLAERKPTMARLVARGVPLLSGDGGAAVRRYCEDVLQAGPAPLPAETLDGARYALSDLVDDLQAAEPGPEGTAIAVETWRRTAELLLDVNGRWRGGGKWLMRELITLDSAAGTTWAPRLDAGLAAALAGDTVPLRTTAEDCLTLAGGRLWEGFHQAAPVSGRRSPAPQRPR